MNSPRDYAFDQLVEGPDRDYFTKGTLLHDFAELAVNHPSFVDSLETDAVVDLMLEELAPLVDERQLEPLETELALGVELIREFLDSSPPVERSYESYENHPYASNTFAEHYDREITSPITEQRFENVDLGAKGVVDLIHNPTRLLDYKTSSSSSERSVVRNSSHRTDRRRAELPGPAVPRPSPSGDPRRAARVHVLPRPRPRRRRPHGRPHARGRDGPNSLSSAALRRVRRQPGGVRGLLFGRCREQRSAKDPRNTWLRGLRTRLRAPRISGH
ncbi:MAG: hypothetical protein U5K37_12825 [Natrialbaceae archaeon]|nr:hypothetical protein [Natrialbaceae archaeon]